LDLKPENILVQKKEGAPFETKLIDFGLAREVVDGSAFVIRQCGSFDYKAPEVKDESQVSPAADMYSFGMFIYMLCVGYFPKALNWTLGKPIPFNRRCWRKYKDTPIQDVVMKCLAANPEDRITAK
jgi:serine/threonine protein kinase